MENLSDSEEIIWAWENIATAANDSLGLNELKEDKPWFHEECLGCLHQRKQTRFRI